MKRIVIIILIVLFCTNLIWFYNKNDDVFAVNLGSETKTTQQSIAKKIIRFHILGNSDSNEDQALKLKVRDKVLEYIAPLMSKCTNIEESRQVLESENKKIRQIAQQVVNANGYSYIVKTELSKVEFPVKIYGAIVLPQGQYEAYRILLGNAEGHNWWCVMFPPLCFTDITKGNVEVEKTKKEMKSVLTPEEYKLVQTSEDEDSSTKIVVKFKIAEEFQKFVNWIKA